MTDERKPEMSKIFGTENWDWADWTTNNMLLLCQDSDFHRIAAALRKAKADGYREAAAIANEAKMDTSRYMTMEPMSVAAIGIRDECLRCASKIEKGEFTEKQG